MDKSASFEKQSTLSSKNNSCKDLSASHSSIKSVKNIENQVSNSSNKATNSKQEKDVHYSKNLDKKVLSQTEVNPKIPHKFITNWKQACDRTRDRTRELLKRWKTLPEFEGVEHLSELTKQKEMEKIDSPLEKSGWSVHVWTTWVDRFSVDNSSEDQDDQKHLILSLTAIQRDKFSYFFTHLLDHDHDDIISTQDFEALSERLRHFADWSPDSPEFHILREVQRGFVETFLESSHDEPQLGFQMNDDHYISLDIWLHRWSRLIHRAQKLSDFPLWLQYFVKVLFQVINRSGSGIVTRDELSAFYSSVLGFDAVKVGEILDHAYQAMTSNGDHQLNFSAYKLCFANYLMARYPNGPGQYIFGFGKTDTQVMFPVDYSALNTLPDDLEHYTPNKQTDRHSVIV